MKTELYIHERFGEKCVQRIGMSLVHMVRLCLCICALLVSSNALHAAETQAIKSFSVSQHAEKTHISFEMKSYQDVEIAILNTTGEIVRHLAAGVLGDHAPAPFQKKSLAQKIVWDGLNNSGEKAKGAPFEVRLRAGAEAKLEKYIGWDGHATHNEQIIVGLRVGAKGQLYVLFSEETWGRSELRVFNADASYDKTLIPYSAHVPEKRLKDFSQLNVGTKKIPYVFNGHSGMLMPLVSGFKRQDMLIDKAGNIILSSAMGTLSNHGPARYLLALHPDGGSPESRGFVGPRILKERGFLGGSGESHTQSFDGMASSPDGTYIYLTMQSESWNLTGEKHGRPHAIYRFQWGDKEIGQPFIGKAESGAGEDALNKPQGLAVDSKGNIYVCDNGNNRIVKFSPKKKFLGSVSVQAPIQISIHEKTNEIYVLSRGPGKSSSKPASALTKFSPWNTGKVPVQISQIKEGKKCYQVMALDPTAVPAKIWLAQYGGWQTPDTLSLVTDNGDSLDKGDNLLSKKGIGYPMFISTDAVNKKVYVTNFRAQVRCLDIKSGKVVEKIRGANEVVVDKEGNRYSMHGWELTMRKADRMGRAVNFDNGSNKIGPWVLKGKGLKGEDEPARSKGPSVGDRGHCFAPNGDLYIIKMAHYGAGRVDIHAPDGSLKKEGVIKNLTWGSSGISVDVQGNIYIGINVRPATGTDFYSDDLKGQVSTEAWKYNRKGERTGAAQHPYFNTYLFHWGSVVKFPPTGGTFWQWSGDKQPADIPKTAQLFRSGYLSAHLAVDGAEWIGGNCGPIPTTGELWGDASCSCWNSRLAADPYGRVFAPDVFHFGVSMMDTAGNAMQQIGSYGNADDSSKNGPIFSWPAYITWADEKVYVADSGNNRVAIIAFEYAASKTKKIK